MVLIGYLILELAEIPAFYREKLIDKLRYLQVQLSQWCSFVHLSYSLFPETFVSCNVKFYVGFQHFCVGV